MEFGDLQYLVVLINWRWRSCIMSCCNELISVLWQLICFMFDFGWPNNDRVFMFKEFTHWNMMIVPQCAYVCMCVHVKDFSSVTDPCHSRPRQLQTHITMPARSLPEPYSQIPRFPQPGFPNRPRISVSCSWMTDGYPWESSMWVFSFIPITLFCF